MDKDQTLEKKQIIDHVKARIDRGEPKQLILEEMTQLYKDKMTIVRTLEVTPSKAMRQKYKPLNFLLVGLLMAVLVLNVILLFKVQWMITPIIIKFTTALNVALNACFLYFVWTYRIEVYSWISSCALITLVTLTSSLYYYEFQEISPLLFISILLILVCFVLGLMLGVKLCPPRVPKIIEVDIDGTEKINKTIYVFGD